MAVVEVEIQLNSSQNSLKRDYSNQDNNNDYIPDNIEALIGTNLNNND